jgi:hypothetical protein
VLSGKSSGRKWIFVLLCQCLACAVLPDGLLPGQTIGALRQYLNRPGCYICLQFTEQENQMNEIVAKVTIGSMILVSGLLVAFLSGCAVYSNTNFTPWSDPGIVHKGAGGTISLVEDIELWQNGSPAKEHYIIGVIEQKSVRSPLLESYNKTEIIKLIKASNGDGAILTNVNSSIIGLSSHANHGAGGVSYSPVHSSEKALVVFQYLD